MKRGLNRELQAGTPVLNPDLSVSVYGGDGQRLHHLPASAFVGGGMGYLFERIVCLHYEARGYAVEQRASLGFRDQGVDLIANAPGERIFVQCKFTTRSIGPQQVERLLYVASKLIRDHRCSGINFFDLAVPCAALAFPVKSHGGRSAALEAFMRHNKLQRQIRLRLVEVPLPMPEKLDVRPA